MDIRGNGPFAHDGDGFRVVKWTMFESAFSPQFGLLAVHVREGSPRRSGLLAVITISPLALSVFGVGVCAADSGPSSDSTPVSSSPKHAVDCSTDGTGDS